MLKNAICCAEVILLLVFSIGYGQTTVLKGRVIDDKNAPLQSAQVKLIAAKKSLTTDQSGNFSIDMTAIQVPQADPVFNTIAFHNGILSFTVTKNPQNVHVEVFDIKGQRVNEVVNNGIGKGTYSIDILPAILPRALYFVKLRIGDRSNVFNSMNLKNRTRSLQDQGPCSDKSILKRSATAVKVIDTLEASKSGYQTVRITLTSYATTLPDIVLKSDGFVLPPIVNGKNAKTTRYWDCCKPSCGWRSNMKVCDINGNVIGDINAKSSCDGGPAFQCMNYAPIEISSKVSYGWAAFNNAGTQCGDCFQIAFQGALNGKQMIVQLINIGNGGTDAFDLLIPGGGVGALNGCSRQWNNAPLGAQYGGFRATCGANKDCILGMCQKAFGDKADLMRGCNWYLNWFEMADNPQVLYMKVSCPQEIKNISGFGN
jgi:hypothetical protein